MLINGLKSPHIFFGKFCLTGMIFLYLCCYPHRSRDALSPVWGIFFFCSIFWPPLPKVQCLNLFDFCNPWGKVMERNGLRFENFWHQGYKIAGKFCLTSRIFLVSVLLSASVERCCISQMQDFKRYINPKSLGEATLQLSWTSNSCFAKVKVCTLTSFLN